MVDKTGSYEITNSEYTRERKRETRSITLYNLVSMKPQEAPVQVKSCRVIFLSSTSGIVTSIQLVAIAVECPHENRSGLWKECETDRKQRGRESGSRALGKMLSHRPIHNHCFECLQLQWVEFGCGWFLHVRETKQGKLRVFLMFHFHSSANHLHA